MAYSPRLLGQPAKPSQIGEKLAKTWDILSPYVTGPVDAWKGLMEADLNTLLYDKGAGGRKAVEDAFNVGGTVTGGSSVVPKPSNALNMGIKAYHASPYSFDKFEWSPKTRGTGEGAQAYGDGLYFAEAENVAKAYKDKFQPNDIVSRRNRQMLKEHGGDWEKAVDNIIRMYHDTPKNKEAYRKQLLKNGPPVAHMYEVNIDADPNAFLDWDKPLSEQPEAVKTALRGYLDPKYGDGFTNQFIETGADFKDVHNNFDDLSPADLAVGLGQQGIPGIKYLDAGSRAPARLAPQLDGLKAQLADAESKLPTAGRHTAMVLKNQIDYLKRQIAMAEQPGTRNYVVFDDKLISIVRKYGIAGASAMLGYNVLEGMDKAQADTLNKADFDYRADEFYRQGGV